MKIEKFFLYFFVSLFVLCIACQEEKTESIVPDDENTSIPKDSELAALVKNVTTHDGSFDDIVDKSYCFSIKLPYSIFQNGRILRIDKEEDYTNLSTSDKIEIQFPVTITLSDYREIVIQDANELSALSSSCRQGEDNDIECIDFIYPIQVSTFNINTNRLVTEEVVHDSVLFQIINTLNSNLIVSVNYPVDLLLHNGEKVEVLHNTELTNAILDVISACNENDN